MSVVLKPALGWVSVFALPLVFVTSVLLGQNQAAPESSERKLVRDAHDAYELDIKRAMADYEKAVKKAKSKLTATYDQAVNAANKKGVAGNKLADELTAEKGAFDIATADEHSVTDGETAISPKRKEILAQLTKKRWQSNWEPGSPTHIVEFTLDGSATSDKFGKFNYKVERRWVLEYGGDLAIWMGDGHWRGFFREPFREVNLRREK